jgi:hypothetical protein
MSLDPNPVPTGNVKNFPHSSLKQSIKTNKYNLLKTIKKYNLLKTKLVIYYNDAQRQNAFKSKMYYHHSWLLWRLWWKP